MIVTYQGVYRTFQTLERLSFGNGALQNEKIAYSSSDKKKNLLSHKFFFVKRVE